MYLMEANKIEMDIFKLLIQNIHEGLKPPSATGHSYLINGLYRYYHYSCDSFQDQGWGCAYRTLQSMASWIIGVKCMEDCPPDIPEIQRTLVALGDKPASFHNSREWIGTMEISFVIDALYEVPCKIIHVSSDDDLNNHATELQNYFENYGGLIMMGGDLDSSSKGIAGVHIDAGDVYLLVIDPHFVASASKAVLPTKEALQQSGYVRWQHVSEFVDSSFYNICMPLLKSSHGQ